MKMLYLLLVILSHPALAQQNDVYLFCYFKGNGEDGLHYAWSEDGLRWQSLRNDSSFLRPTAGKDKLMRDPCIIRGKDGRFHMVWTVSWNEKGIGYASSNDLINWSAQQFIPVMAKEDSARNCWAPEITLDPSTGKYIIYWATTIRGKFKETASAKESGYNHRIYYTTTEDFKKFSNTGLLYDEGFNVIDATIIPYNNAFVMFLKDETPEPVQKNIRIAYGKKSTGPYSKPGNPVTGKYWAEGPTVLRRNGEWIVYFDKYRDHQYGAIRSTDLNNWTDISDHIQLPAGLRHGTIVSITRAELTRLLQHQ